MLPPDHSPELDLESAVPSPDSPAGGMRKLLLIEDNVVNVRSPPKGVVGGFGGAVGVVGAWLLGGWPAGLLVKDAHGG